MNNITITTRSKYELDAEESEAIRLAARSFKLKKLAEVMSVEGKKLSAQAISNMLNGIIPIPGVRYEQMKKILGL